MKGSPSEPESISWSIFGTWTNFASLLLNCARLFLTAKWPSYVIAIWTGAPKSKSCYASWFDVSSPLGVGSWTVILTFLDGGSAAELTDPLLPPLLLLISSILFDVFCVGYSLVDTFIEAWSENFSVFLSNGLFLVCITDFKVIFWCFTLSRGVCINGTAFVLNCE